MLHLYFFSLSDTCVNKKRLTKSSSSIVNCGVQKTVNCFVFIPIYIRPRIDKVKQKQEGAGHAQLKYIVFKFVSLPGKFLKRCLMLAFIADLLSNSAASITRIRGNAFAQSCKFRKETLSFRWLVTYYDNYDALW